MSTSSIAGQGDSRISASTDLTQAHAQYEAERAAAHARPCDIAGCDGSAHEPTDDGNMHRFAETEFDGGEVLIEGYFYKGHYSGSVVLSGVSDDMSAADLRAKADLYEELPTLLRQYADTIDARTIEAIVQPFTGETTIAEIFEAAQAAGVGVGATIVAAQGRLYGL